MNLPLIRAKLTLLLEKVDSQTHAQLSTDEFRAVEVVKNSLTRIQISFSGEIMADSYVHFCEDDIQAITLVCKLVDKSKTMKRTLFLSGDIMSDGISFGFQVNPEFNRLISDLDVDLSVEIFRID